MKKTSILIVGAGPSGLLQALWLKKKGVNFRIIDKSEKPGETSRALAVQARTLEFYRQLGIDQRILPKGIIAREIILRRKGKIVTRAPLGAMGEGISPYPHLFFCSQDVHEAALCEELKNLGVEVERKTELVRFSQNENGVQATLRSSQGDEQVEAEYLVGCDGAHSAVRHGLGVDFPGGTYSQIFFVADVIPTEPLKDIAVQVSVSRKDFCIIMPIQTKNTTRLTGIVPEESENKKVITFEDVRAVVEENTGIKAAKVNWFTTYHVHHRVVDNFRKGRVFLAGDAAHIHSPAGGQGMNTGIGDSINLAWKLAEVLQGRASKKILDSYEPERKAFARVLVATTDTAFRFLASRTLLGSLFRAYLLPTVFSLLARLKPFLKFAFLTISQTRIKYRNSLLSKGWAGEVVAGDRLPWMKFGEKDNYEPLKELSWQLHIYGAASEQFQSAAKKLKIPLFIFPEAVEKGLGKNALYLIRPDGYIAFASEQQNFSELENYLNTFSIR